MFSNYIILHYINSFVGLSYFSFKITNNEITLSQSKVKLFYCVILLPLLCIYLITTTYVSCLQVLRLSFLTSITHFGFMIGWFILYLNNYFQTKKFMLLLKKFFQLEKKTTLRRRNTYLFVYALHTLLLLIILVTQYFNVTETIYTMSKQCIMIYFIVFLGNTPILFTFVFLISELRVIIMDWQDTLKIEKNSNFDLEKYNNVLMDMKNIFKNLHIIFQLPITVVISLNFVNVLQCFYGFLYGDLFRTGIEDLPQKLSDLYAGLMWFTQSLLAIIILVYEIEGCAKELKVFSDMIAAQTESINLEYNQVLDLFSKYVMRF